MISEKIIDTDSFQHVSIAADQVVGRVATQINKPFKGASDMGTSAAIIENDTSITPIRNADAPMVAMIERIALDPSIPIDRLEKMMAMKERMEDRAREDQEFQARKAYFAAMSVCQAELPVVVKKSRNNHTNSNYADLAAIEDQAMPIIHKHGFGVSFQPDGYNEKGELRIQWEISHAEGYVKNGVGEIPVDAAGAQGKVNKTGTQAFGSTATYGRRYLLCMLFNISTGDDRDGNNEKPRNRETISQDQVKVILGLLADTDSDVEQFCRMGKIEAVPDMLAIDFEDAVRLLNAKLTKLSQRAAS
ncbi:ERF family protein [Phyllobacterium sp. 22229]|uniref:ERF family protein n=1 Tax=Phyllobacterium sp. 22229 TaxID=3453895 RepID=UPI003F86364C